MKILLAGGGSGGHFYPLIATARALKDLAQQEKIVNLELWYVADEPYAPELLREEEIKFIKVPAGKLRRYFSFWNFVDVFKTVWGLGKALWVIYLNFPDVIFAKGGYASFPALAAARIFGIPLVIHDSDAVPGKVSLWASRFAKRIAISFPESLKYFPEAKTALTGNPIRREVLGGNPEEAREIFGLGSSSPVLLVLGGSQGADKINQVVLDVLPELLKTAEIIHQAGQDNLDGVKLRSKVILENDELSGRYHPFGFLEEGALRGASRVANLAVARAGAGTIFELAAWGVPSILIPLSHAAQNHQRANAYAYAREGGALVIEEENLTPHILLSEVTKLLYDKKRLAQMSKAAQAFSKVDAAGRIAEEIIKLALAHS